MRILAISLGTRGDVQPFVAMAQALRARGHIVAICCSCSSADLVREHGFEAFGMTMDTRKVVTSSQMQSAMRTGDGNACVAAFFEAQEEQKRGGADSIREADDFIGQFRPDMILGHPSFLSFVILAEKYGVPVVNTMFMPFLPSRESYAVFKTKDMLAEQGLLDDPLETHRELHDMVFNDTLLLELNGWREAWGLKPYSSVSEMQSVYQSLPTANCWSPALHPEPADLAEEFPLARQTGYLFAEEPVGYSPPAELAAFLEEPGAEKPIYVGFGSLSAGDPRLLTEKVLRALILAGRRRCVLLGGWSGIGPEHLDPELSEGYEELKSFAHSHVVQVSAAPHSWLLPKCAAAVHHGGAGTTAAAARAGLPVAIAPFAWDQPAWAERVEELGLGVSLRAMITAVSAEDLGHAIVAITSSDVVTRAAAMGAQIRAEGNGHEKLADFAEASFSAPFAWPTANSPVPVAPLPPLWDRPSIPALTSCSKDVHGDDYHEETLLALQEIPAGTGKAVVVAAAGA